MTYNSKINIEIIHNPCLIEVKNLKIILRQVIE